MKFKNIVATALVLFAVGAGAVLAEPLHVCKNIDYALCAASPTTPTGKTMKVNGKTFKEGMAACPILHGDAAANLNLMNGSCDAPGPGKIWSLFGIPAQTSYPQQPTWAVAPAQFRSFIIGTTPTTGMSNMWSFPCEIQAQKVNGVKLASCYGPIMESPWTNDHVKPGQIGFTQAAEGVTYPVGGNAPANIGSKK